MNLFFTIFGFIFVSVFSTVTNYIYDLYPINRITSFFSPISRGLWGNISINYLPIVLWSFIEVPVLCTNNMFIISVILYLVVSCLLIYVIKYGAMLFNKSNNIINLISIYISALIGSILSYMILILGSSSDRVVAFSVIGVIFIAAFYVVITLFPPKINFFKDENTVYDNQKK